MTKSENKPAKKELWFKKTFSLNGMHLKRSQDAPVNLVLSDDVELVVWMRSFENKPEIKPQLCCSSIKKFLVKPKVYAMFESLSQGYLPEESAKTVEFPYRLGMDATIDVDRKLPEKWAVPLEVMPGAFRNIHDTASGELSELIKNFVKVMRWHQGASGAHSPFASVSFEWSFNKKDWSNVPSGFSISMSTPKGIDIDRKALEAVKNLVLEGVDEPTYHALLREAISVANSNPRSSLLIAFSALEMALKSFVGYLVPNSDILMEKMPSPSVYTVTQEVIPAILAEQEKGSDFFPLDREGSDLLKNWMTQRNKVAHGMQTDVRPEKLYGFLKFVRQVLYQCDAHRGHEWASTIGSLSHDIPS